MAALMPAWSSRVPAPVFQHLVQTVRHQEVERIFVDAAGAAKTNGAIEDGLVGKARRCRLPLQAREAVAARRIPGGRPPDSRQPGDQAAGGGKQRDHPMSAGVIAGKNPVQRGDRHGCQHDPGERAVRPVDPAGQGQHRGTARDRANRITQMQVTTGMVPMVVEWSTVIRVECVRRRLDGVGKPVSGAVRQKQADRRMTGIDCHDPFDIMQPGGPFSVAFGTCP